MDDDWWPDLLAHIPLEDPWDAPDVVVTEIRSYDDPWFPGVRFLWSALVPLADLDALDGQRFSFDYQVESTGRPGPGPNVAGSLNPRFWIAAYFDDRRVEFEPLVLGWESNNQTALVLDPRFAMTYGLMPRPQTDGATHWDNPAYPEYDVAVIGAPSIYEDLSQSKSTATISRDYLQDYLTLRGMALVQVYYESRRGEDAAAEAILGDKSQVNEKLRTREVDVRRRREGGIIAQIWGSRIVARPGDLPITSDPLDEVGLVWPGSAEPVTNALASRFRPWDYVYVRDTVLAGYEGTPGFRVSAETGGVGYTNQWSVGPATRVGRDVIRLEIRKLYEGTPSREIRRWHGHAVSPSAELLAPEAMKVKNIGVRSKDLIYGLADVGLMLSGLSARLLPDIIPAKDFVQLDPAWMTYNGWWNEPFVEPITRHIPLDLSRSEFFHRCLLLDKVLVEALGQSSLRRLVRSFGTPLDEIERFRSLKLLDRIVCLCRIGNDAGLSPWTAGQEIVARLQEAPDRAYEPLSKMFALTDLRQAAGHRKDEDAVLTSALERFGLATSDARSGWGYVLDTIYDQLAAQLAEVRAIVAETLGTD